MERVWKRYTSLLTWHGAHTSTLLISSSVSFTFFFFSFLHLHLRWGSFGMTQNNRDLPNACWETKKGFTVSQTAVLTRPGTELLQSCLELAAFAIAACQLVCRFGWPYLVYWISPLELSILGYRFFFFFMIGSQILAEKGCCSAVMSHGEKARVKTFKNKLFSHDGEEPH